jgi:hypothetical protein
MADRQASGVVICLVGAGLAATAFHWLITPTVHPGASSARVLAVWLQFGAGGALAILGYRRDRLDRARYGAAYQRLAAAAVLGLAGALLAGLGGHWLITPAAHPGAPLWHLVGVWGQVLLGMGLFASARRHAVATAAT